jgi:hypothetical protein
VAYPELNETFLGNILLFEVSEIEKIIKPSKNSRSLSTRLVLGQESLKYNVSVKRFLTGLNTSRFPSFWKT